MVSIWHELRRRNVVRVGIGYAVLTWLLLQVADVILGNIEAPDWVFRGILLVLVLGFPVALFLAWAFELTPEGLKKEKDVDRDQSITQVTGRKLDRFIIVLLAAAAGYLAVDKFVFAPPLSNDNAEVTHDQLASQPDESGPAKTSIAVLPFANMSEDPNNEYFADGISEEILNLLANIPELQVTSRSSAFSFKGQNVDVPTMAATLNVAHVLEGSVRKSGDRLRITAQLIRVSTDTHLWSETFDRELINVFEIQDEIAVTVADAMEVALLGKKPKAAETDPEAYALYLQARQIARQGSDNAITQTEALLKQSLEIDPTYAPGWLALADNYFFQTALLGLRSYEDGMELARASYQEALAQDPAYARAQEGLGRIALFYDGNYPAADRFFQQALVLGPGDARILRAVGRLELTMGRIDTAIELYRQSLTLDPLGGHTGLGTALYMAGENKEAAELFATAVSLNPNAPARHYRLSRALLAQGKPDEALATIQAEPEDSYKLAGLALIQHARGATEAADGALRELIELYSEGGAYQIAETYAFRGKSDEAIVWLEKAYEVRDSGLISVLPNPLFVSLHNDPRWVRFLDKMGLPY